MRSRHDANPVTDVRGGHLLEGPGQVVELLAGGQSSCQVDVEAESWRRWDEQLATDSTVRGAH